MRLVVGLTLLALLGDSTRAWALAAQIGDPVAVVGRPVSVRLEVLDDPGVVHRVVVEIRSDGQPWRSREAVKGEGGWWIARFEAGAVWSLAAVTSKLQARATAFGRRGGIVLQIGHQAPLELTVLTPDRAAQRARDLQSASPSEAEEDPLVLTGVVGVQVRLADPARVRVLVGASAPLSRTWSVGLNMTFGPAFDEPPDRTAGALALGVEPNLRLRSGPGRVGAFSSFAGPRLGVELRLPGADGLVGLETGVGYGLSKDVALELSLVGSALLLNLIDDRPVELGFTGGVRAALRLGRERA